ncbi:N-acetyltransferase [Verticiella sediminum]|uniref:N-acetyltransferase n=1 Tax=Verticiella sediminum TaxID=1247510 RepID=A0A556AJF1_9BURK|nr:GNAT family N-acetyltransferase [Verticiella sediminum]TSH93003.1 N-acetyltransferase [Verticiella sediminum]
MSTWKPSPSLADIDAERWAQLAAGDPTLSAAFLGALQASGSASQDSGWQPAHLVREGASAVLPLYAKSHSYGEYVFDHGWANAAHRAGLRYYPKLVTAVPFTPAAGRRLLTGTAALDATLAGEAYAAVRALAERGQVSSWHLLFPDDSEAPAWASTGLLHRLGCQYHWFDRGYGDFDGFLGRFRQSRRKTVKRERRLVAEQGVDLATLDGTQLEPHHWQVFYQCYRDTYEKRSGHAGYLNQAFFAAMARDMPEQVVMTLATHEGRYVAAALCLRSADTLYGRYWGALDDFANLHFEACYYQGIEYCLAHGLTRFDPGAQGEHKIPRGFEPVLTHSFHWLAEPRLANAVADFLAEERVYMQDYARDARELLPFHRAPAPE